jgi:RHS repeat-associated protein
LHQNSGATGTAGGVGRLTGRAFSANGGSLYRWDTGPFATVSYTEANGRIISWTDVRGTQTTFTYGAGGLLFSATSPPGGTALPVIQYFRPGEAAALASPDVEAQLYTALYSVRWPDVQAFKRLRLGPWGNPTQLVDEWGRETLITPDVNFPLLAARVRQPNGYSSWATYQAGTGNLLTLTTDPRAPGEPSAVTTYAYQSGFPDNVTSVTDPTGLVSTYGYDAAPIAPWQYPLLRTQRTGTAVGADVTFSYYTTPNASGLPESITGAEGKVTTAIGLQRPIDSFAYDALGNLSETRSAAGKRVTYLNDGIGRVLTAKTLLGVMSWGDRWLTDSTAYDELDRVRYASRSAWGDGTAGSGPQSYEVYTRYLGYTGLPVAVERTASDGTMGTLRDSTAYDLIGRTVQRFAQGATLPESLTYNQASNVTRRVTPRGGEIKTTYDALNRPATVITSAMPYTSMRIGTAAYTGYDAALTPAYPRVALGRSGNPLVVDGDTATFTYDLATGQIAFANNRAALVSRTYFLDGALQSETQRVRTVTGDDFAQHVYTMQYAYDVVGRRRTLTHPTQLAPGSATETWWYNSVAGLPDSVRDPLDGVVDFRFDAAGQLIQQRVPNGIARQLAYSLDGEVMRDELRKETTPLAPLDPVGSTDVLSRYRNVVLTYDPRGKLLTMQNALGLQESMTLSYTPLGALRSSAYASRYYDYVDVQLSNAVMTSNETIRTDALGTVTWSQSSSQNYNFSTQGARYTDGRYDTPGARIPSYTPNTGRLHRTTTPTGRDTLWYDASGNTIVQQHIDSVSVGGAPGEASERVMYYNAAEQLVAVDARIGSAPGWTNALHFVLSFDEHRYDALGRRVFTRSQRRCPTNGNGVDQGADFFTRCQLGFVQRTVWDGGKELYEIKMPDQSQHWEKDGLAAGDTLGLAYNNAVLKTVDRDAYYGRVGYVYGGAFDQPLVVLRQDYGDRQYRPSVGWLPYYRYAAFALYPQWDQRGEPSIGTVADGGKSRCVMVSAQMRCTYALAWTQVWAPNGKPVDAGWKGWTGSLLEDKRDASGLLYRRNRYVDPATGRFTQPDPIGLSGGLNSYGYASGDPVNFSDPFGLCPYEGERRTANIEDCPNDLRRDAFRLIRDYGGETGKNVIGHIVSNNVSVVAEGVGVLSCVAGTTSTGCYDRETRTIFLNGFRRAGGTAGTVMHESLHAGSKPGILSTDEEENNAKQRGFSFYTHLPKRFRNDADYEVFLRKNPAFSRLAPLP